MVKCAACGKFIKGGVVCPHCFSQSHNECIKIPSGVKVSSDWRCGECKSKGNEEKDPCALAQEIQESSRSSLIEQKPQKPACEEAMVLDDTAHNITAEFTEMELQLHTRTLQEEMMSEFNKMQQSIFAELSSFKAEFRTLCSEMRDFKKEFSELRSSLVSCTDRVIAVENRVMLLEQERSEGVNLDQVMALERTIYELKSELNDREQESLLNDVEITGLPEQKGENPVHFVSVLATAIGLSLNEQDIVFAERSGAVPRPPQGESSSAAARPRKIVLRFSRRSTHDAYLRAARVRRGLSSADLGVDGSPAVRVFVNERLSRLNRQLFAKAREECRRRQWKYCWTKEGRIYVRREHGSAVTRIRTDKDICQIFGVGIV